MTLVKTCCFAVLSALVISGCKNVTKEEPEAIKGKTASEPLFSHITASESGIDFINKVNEKDSINVLNFQNYYNGTGCAVGDIDNDGLVDVFFTANQSGSKLYRNKGDFKFEDITEKAGISTPGWCTGAVMGDVNNDGYMDIYVARSGVGPNASTQNLLFINNKNGTFTEKGKEAGIDDSNLSTSATMFDIDNDGDLDIYVLNYPNRYDLYLDNQFIERTRAEENVTHRMYENDGTGKFKDITKQAGMFSFGFGLSATPGDFNRDGYMDLYVCNDFMTPDFLYINNKNNTFTNKHSEYFKHTTFSSMGSDVADYNNDGLIDLFIVDMLPEDHYSRKMMAGSVNWDVFKMAQKVGYGQQFMKNTLHLNNGNGYFSEIAGFAGVIATDWSWTPLFADFDNDGYKDLFISNGVYRDVTNNDFMNYQYDELRGKDKNKMDRRNLLDHIPFKQISSYVYKNNGDLTFKNVTSDWGLNQKKNASTGASYADFDNDGDIDIIAASINDNVLLYRNNAEKTVKNNWLKLKLRGTESNYYGYGSKIIVKTAQGEQYFECTGFRGFQSSSDPDVNIGLGANATASEVTVVWPTGKMQVLKDVKANQVLTVNEKDASGMYKAPAINQTQVFTAFNTGLSGFQHTEDGFVDFKRDRLVPHLLSRLGPAIAVADVNGDGADDFFAGNGAVSKGGKLYLQGNSGGLKEAPSQPWSSDNKGDNMGCLFFDLENDGDMDLYIANGGNHQEGDHEAYKHHIYINNGKGGFSKGNGVMPDITSNGSVVTGADYDGDGDIDLFVGGRGLPGQYPKPSRSYILRNDNGKLVDATQEVNAQLADPGMVCAAVWSDCNGDNKPDLLVTGEFMNIMVFTNQNGKLVNSTNTMGLAQSQGWWNSLTPGDFDNDGDIDYIAGNRGLNCYMKASPAEPVTVYANDFDKNGSLDPILCYYVMGKNYPHAMLKDLASQMPAIQRNYRKYDEYAKQTVDQVFKKEDLDAAVKLEARYFTSCFIENIDNKTFKIKELPAQAQFAPIYGTTVMDYNGDGNLDVLAVGNSLSPQIELGHEDAMNGLVLEGDGKGNFTPRIGANTGFYAPYDAKSLVQLPGNGQTLLLVGNNSNSLQGFKVKTGGKSFTFGKNEYKLEITLADGKKQLIENGYGCGYLSQNSRKVTIPANAKSAKVYGFDGKAREVSF